VRAASAPQQPITLSRNGKDFKITANQSTVRAGTEIRVKTERPEVAISLTEMAKDSWVVFELRCGRRFGAVPLTDWREHGDM
jgi:hypothetical protein